MQTAIVSDIVTTTTTISTTTITTPIKSSKYFIPYYMKNIINHIDE